MDTLHIIVLALIQGITEFLPISSSGHLILPAGLLGWPDQGLAFDVAVHVGTLLAVLAYFRQTIINISGAWLTGFYKKEQTPDSKLGWYIILATIPAGFAGLVFNDFIEVHLRGTLVIALTTILFGLLLGWADYLGQLSKQHDLTRLTITIVLIIGCAQALALIPGTSRSGITITAALFCGLHRQSAAQFSFLIAIPIIILSGGYKALELITDPITYWNDIFLGIAVSAVSAFICIFYFMKFINRIGMLPFVVYRLVLGGGLLIWIFI
ncbi:MAG: undecaprenyl-diphosphatase [Cellvibrionaceae bacterium]|jgi:undecaprenyl-diphosphatase